MTICQVMGLAAGTHTMRAPAAVAPPHSDAAEGLSKTHPRLSSTRKMCPLADASSFCIMRPNPSTKKLAHAYDDMGSALQLILFLRRKMFYYSCDEQYDSKWYTEKLNETKRYIKKRIKRRKNVDEQKPQQSVKKYK